MRAWSSSSRIASAAGLPSARSAQPDSPGPQGGTRTGSGGTAKVSGAPPQKVSERPWSTRATLPRATLTSSIGPQSLPPCVDRQTGKVSASSGAQVTSTTGCSYSSSTRWVTEVSRTAWRCAGSASAAAPVRGPSTSSMISRSPGRSARCPVRASGWSASCRSSRRVAEVAPRGRTQSWSPQVQNRMVLCAGCSTRSAPPSGSNTSTAAVRARVSSSSSGITVDSSGRSCGPSRLTSTAAKRKVPGRRVRGRSAVRATNARALQPSCTG